MWESSFGSAVRWSYQDSIQIDKISKSDHTSVGEDCVERSYPAGGAVNTYSHLGKEFGNIP